MTEKNSGRESTGASERARTQEELPGWKRGVSREEEGPRGDRDEATAETAGCAWGEKRAREGFFV